MLTNKTAIKVDNFKQLKSIYGDLTDIEAYLRWVGEVGKDVYVARMYGKDVFCQYNYLKYNKFKIYTYDEYLEVI